MNDIILVTQFFTSTFRELLRVSQALCILICELIIKIQDRFTIKYSLCCILIEKPQFTSVYVIKLCENMQKVYVVYKSFYTSVYFYSQKNASAWKMGLVKSKYDSHFASLRVLNSSPGFSS